MSRFASLSLVVALVLLLSQTAFADEPILLEAESPSVKHSDASDFATPSKEISASGKMAVARFFVGGHAAYDFTVDQPGRYHVWLRYAANGPQKFQFAVDPPSLNGEIAWATTPGKATGGLTGKDVWRWVKLATARLGSGEHTFALASRPCRPDCILITSEDAEPNDETLGIVRVVRLTPEQLSKVAKPIEPIRPDWLDEAEGYELPDWIDAERAQIHTRLSPTWMDRNTFWTAGAGMKAMGASAFTRHIKTGGEGAWWPSRVGAILPEAENRNIAKEIIDEAHANGCRVIVYHRHMEDEAVAKAHPDWCCRTDRGEIHVKRGPKVCFNTPYADIVLTRLLELTEMGADGFYFDEVHMPKQGCWCEACQEGFKKATGLAPPTEVNPHNPIWHKYVEFKNVTIERLFLKWRRAIHEKNPECVLLIGSNAYPTLVDRHTTHRLYRIADLMKTEFHLPAKEPGGSVFPRPPEMLETEPETKIALGYTLSRDATDGRPAHIWIPHLQDEASATYSAAGVMTYGCIANLDVQEASIPNPIFHPAMQIGARASTALAGARPLRYAAIHYPETARDRWLLDSDAVWTHILYPFYGAFRALHLAHVPVGVVTDSQLEEGRLDGYRVLVLPSPETLTDPMRAAVEDFQRGGGLVIKNDSTWRWEDPTGGHEAAREALLQMIPAYGEPNGPPVDISTAPTRMHVVPFAREEGQGTAIAICNEFTWVDTSREQDPEDRPSPPSPLPPMTLRVRLDEKDPLAGNSTLTARDVISGRPLRCEQTGEHEVQVEIPLIEVMAVVVVKDES